MLYIGNLVEFVRLIIDNNDSGTFWPQNREYSNTSGLVKIIAEAHGKKICLFRGFTWALKIMSHFTPIVNKAFGNLVYDMEISQYSHEYRTVSLEESINISEGKL